jgi:hypothetical protein
MPPFSTGAEAAMTTLKPTKVSADDDYETEQNHETKGGRGEQRGKSKWATFGRQVRQYGTAGTEDDDRIWNKQISEDKLEQYGDPPTFASMITPFKDQFVFLFVGLFWSSLAYEIVLWEGKSL